MFHIFSGDSAVTAAVNGPIEVKLHNLLIDKAHVEVYYRSKSGLPSIDDKLREKVVRDTCESALLTVLYPRSSIYLQIHEMENSGGVRRFFFRSCSSHDIIFISYFVILVDCLFRECFVSGSFK